MTGLSPEEQERFKRLLKLPPETIDRLEKVARDDERAEWLWGVIRRGAAFITVVLGSLILFGEQVKAFVRFIVKGVSE